MLETIAAGAIAILSPYLAEAGKGFAKKAKFTGDHDAEQALALVEAKPASQGRLLTLQELLTERMSSDSDFASTIENLVREAKEADSRKLLVFGERNIVANRDVTESTLVTGDNNVVSKH